jgi:hypothetical protein
MTAPKRLAVEGHGGKEMVRNRSAGQNSREIWSTNNHPIRLYGEQVTVN